MLDQIMTQGFNGLMYQGAKKLNDRDHYIEYIIDTSLPPKNPMCYGDSDLWVRMQNLYYADVTITSQYKVKGDLSNTYFEEYDMTIHCDVRLPYSKIAITFQQAIADIIGPTNRLFGVIKIYRKEKKFQLKDGFYLIKETPMLNVYTKA